MILGGMTVFGATSAHATDFYNTCGVSDGYKVCASSQVTWDGNSLVMKVWNMEGMGSSDIFGMAHVMTAVGLTQDGAMEKESKKSASMFSSFQVLFNGEDFSHYWTAGAKRLQLVLGGTRIRGTEGGIIGCADPQGASIVDGKTTSNHYSTCGNYPNNPYLEFTFSGFSSDFDYAAYNTFEYHSQQTGENDEGSIKVSGGPNPPPTNVVPEPFSMALLGTGLAGVAIARRRRRREADDEV